MLIVHPSSTCDVCLDPFTWQTPSHTPHAIPCGHVFCLSCLQSTTPSLCPLCRKGFSPDRVKKLHVDRFSGSPTEGNVSAGGNVGFSTQEAELLHRLAMVSGENAPDEDMDEVMSDVQRWLTEGHSREAPSDSPPQHRSTAVYNAVTALHRYRIVRHQQDRKYESLRRQRDELLRRLNVTEHDVQQARAVEDNLVANLREAQDGAKKSSELEAELSRLRHENHQLRSKYVVSSNPLPPPPRPWTACFTDPPNVSDTSHSRHSVQSSIPSQISPNNRASSSRPPQEPANPAFNVGSLAPDHRPRESEPRQERKPRPPVMIPGAHPTKKVIPKPEHSDEVPMAPPEPATFPAGHSTYPYFEDPSSASHVGPSGSRRPPQAGSTTRASSYGYPPFPGPVPPPQDDWHSAPSRAHDGGEEAALGSLRLYSGVEPRYPSSHPRRTPPTIEDAARAIGITGEGSRSSGSSRVRPGEGHDLASSVHGQPTVYTSANPSTSQSTNYLDLRIGPTPGSEGPVIPPLPEDTSFLGLVRTENAVPRPEPSPASTWGTVPTPRVSNNSSMMDLGLRGLPEATLGSEPSANSSLGDLGLTNLPPLGVPSGNSSMSDFGLPSLTLDTLSLNNTNPRAGVADEQPSSGESIRSNLSSSNSHRRPRESHVTYGHPVDSRENSSTRQPNVNDNNVISSRATSRNSHFSELDQSGRRSRESSRSSSGTSSQLSSRNESLTDLVLRPSRGSRHGSSHDSASERGRQGSSESVNSADMGMSSLSQNMRAIPGSSFVRPTNGQEARENTKQQRRRVSFGPVTHEIVNVYPRHDEHVEDPSELMTPKGKPMSYSHSKSSRHYHHRHSTSSGEGLGLSLPSSTSRASSRQGINNENDLNLVDQSLMQLVEGESREHRHHRHSRHTSGTDSLDQHPSQLIGSRTGYVIYGSGPPSAHGSQGSPSTEPSTLPSTERKAPVPLERRSASDTQQPRQEEIFIMHGHGNSRDDTIRPRRRPSTSTATLSSMGSSAHGNRHSAHVHSSASSTENHHHHHHNNQHPTEDVSDLSRRSSNKRHRQTPGPEVVLPPSSSEYPPAVGGGGLLLSFTPAPPGPSTSAATTADGEPSSIYAPRPVSSRHNSNLFGLWNARSDR